MPWMEIPANQGKNMAFWRKVIGHYLWLRKETWYQIFCWLLWPGVIAQVALCWLSVLKPALSGDERSHAKE